MLLIDQPEGEEVCLEIQSRRNCLLMAAAGEVGL